MAYYYTCTTVLLSPIGRRYDILYMWESTLRLGIGLMEDGTSSAAHGQEKDKWKKISLERNSRKFHPGPSTVLTTELPPSLLGASSTSFHWVADHDLEIVQSSANETRNIEIRWGLDLASFR